VAVWAARGAEALAEAAGTAAPLSVPDNALSLCVLAATAVAGYRAVVAVRFERERREVLAGKIGHE
jgi:hypothetical protein